MANHDRYLDRADIALALFTITLAVITVAAAVATVAAIVYHGSFYAGSVANAFLAGVLVVAGMLLAVISIIALVATVPDGIRAIRRRLPLADPNLIVCDCGSDCLRTDNFCGGCGKDRRS